MRSQFHSLAGGRSYELALGMSLLGLAFGLRGFRRFRRLGSIRPSRSALGLRLSGYLNHTSPRSLTTTVRRKFLTIFLIALVVRIATMLTWMALSRGVWKGGEF